MSMPDDWSCAPHAGQCITRPHLWHAGQWRGHSSAPVGAGIVEKQDHLTPRCSLPPGTSVLVCLGLAQAVLPHPDVPLIPPFTLSLPAMQICPLTSSCSYQEGQKYSPHHVSASRRCCTTAVCCWTVLLDCWRTWNCTDHILAACTPLLPHLV